MNFGPSIAHIASLIGDAARANILTALMGGQPLTATELAARADITKQTASAHLSKLLDAGLITVQSQGRDRYFELSDEDVAYLLESLMGVAYHAGALRLSGSEQGRRVGPARGARVQPDRFETASHPERRTPSRSGRIRAHPDVATIARNEGAGPGDHVTGSVTLEAMLRGSRWASALTSGELDLVCKEAHERIVPEGAVFAQAGTPADHWMGVIEGMVKMSVSLPNGRESTFTAVSAGGWFGEGTLLKSESWRYDVVAVRGSRLAYVPRAAFERLLNTSLAFNRSMLAQMNARLSLFIGLAVYDRLLSADTRVARCLASLFSSDLYPGTSSFVKLSQDEIGLLSAVSRQRANQALHALQQAGLLRIEFGGVTVLDVQGLWRFSGDSEVRDVPRNHR